MADPSFPTPDGAADEVAKTATLIWLNGTLSHGNALTSVRDRGLLLGDGLYETALVVNRRPLLWEQHLQRLLASAAALAFHLPDGFVSTVDAALDTFLAALPPNECWLRLTLTTGAGARGLSRPPAPAPTLLLQAGALRPRCRPDSLGGRPGCAPRRSAGSIGEAQDHLCYALGAGAAAGYGSRRGLRARPHHSRRSRGGGLR